MRRSATAGLLASAALLVPIAGVSARTNNLLIDIRVHGTGAKEVYVTNPGDTFTLDILATVTGSDSDPTNDGLNGFAGSFLSSNGGLLGNLTPLNVQSPFTALSSSPGVAADLDGDGDLDIGSNATAAPTGYFATRAGTYIPVNQTLVGQFTFTALSLSAASTDIIFRGSSIPSSVGVKFDGVGALLRATQGPFVSYGLPVTVRAQQIIGNGSTSYLSGTVNTHVTVDGTVLPTAGSTVVLTNGLTVHTGGVFDMRDTSDGNTENHEVRVDDGISGNEGGSLFVRKLSVGYSTNGTFTQSAGLTSIDGDVIAGVNSAANGVVRATGGTWFINTLTLGSGGSGTLEQMGGQTSVSTLNARPAAGKTSTTAVSGGTLNLTIANLSSVNGGIARYVQTGGTSNASDEVTLTGTTSTADVTGTLNDGTLKFNRLTVAGHAGFTQNAGTLRVDSLKFVPGAATTGDGFILNGGTATILGIVADGRTGGTVPTFVQNGGTLESSAIIGMNAVSEGVTFTSGQAHVHAMSLEFSTVRQTGGNVSIDSVDLSALLSGGQNIRSGYKLFGGTLSIHSQWKGAGTIDFNNAASHFTAADGSLVDFSKTTFLNSSSAIVSGEHGSLMEFATGSNPLSIFGSFSSDGIVHVAGEPLTIPAAARVGGSGAITGNTTNDGTISPGNSPGEIDIAGNFSQGANGHLEMQIGGANADQFDLLAITGSAALDGSLDVSLLDNFKPTASNTFTILTATSGITGRFANTIGNQVWFDGGRFDVAYGANGITLSNFAAVPEPTTFGALMFAAGSLLARRRRIA